MEDQLYGRYQRSDDGSRCKDVDLRYRLLEEVNFQKFRAATQKRKDLEFSIHTRGFRAERIHQRVNHIGFDLAVSFVASTADGS